MSHGRPDLRFDAPVLEPTEALVHRLAATARSSRSLRTERRHRLAVVAASFLGVSTISAGGAWAVGAIDVSGLPSSPLTRVEDTRDPVPQDRRDGDPASGTGTGTDADPGPGAEPPAPLDPKPETGRGADQIAQSPAEPRPTQEPGLVPREAAPEDADPGQEDERHEDKGDNGEGREQDKQNGQGDNSSENGRGNGKDKVRQKQDPPGADRGRPTGPGEDARGDD
jgi:hypothetical protein